MNDFIHRALRAGVALTALMLPTVAIAQTSSTADASTDANAALPDTGLADIIVTANRTASTVQRTPATISAFSAEALTKSGTTSTLALQNTVPGLTFTSGNAGQTLLYLRGTGTSVLGLGAGASVATYVDGVYYPNQQQGLQKFNSIERIEVLKGPQATLFGRNATAGAISIVTRKPSDTFALDADASYGNYNAQTLRATVTGPVTDKLSALFSGVYDKHRGYNYNLTLGNRPGADNLIAVRAALRYEASPDIELVVRGDYAYRRFSDYAKATNPDDFLYNFTPVSDYIADPRQVRNNYVNSGSSRDRGVSATLTAGLGRAVLTSITSYRFFHSGPIVTDTDSNDGPFIPASNSISQLDGDELKSRQFYHETYIASDRTMPVFATVGVNYSRERANQFIFRPLFLPYTVRGTIAQTYLRNLQNNTSSAFVDGGINVSDRVTVTAGVRYSHDKKRYSQDGIFPAGNIPRGILLGNRTDESLSPKFGIEYRPSNDVMFYASATSGFKAGGYAENDPRNTFKPEKIWSYEAGFKSTLWDRRARLNASFFYADYRDLQVQQIIGGVVPTRLISNAEGAKIYGVDFEATVQPVRRLSLGVSGEYLHTRISDALLCDPTLPCTGGLPPFNAGIRSPRGNRLPNAPKWSLIGSVDYDLPISNGSVNLHGDASYRSLSYFNYFGIASLDNGTPLAQPSYVNLNAQIRYMDKSGWSLAVYGQNLTNRLVRTWMDTSSQYSSTLPLTNLGTSATTRFGPPRVYGVTLGYKL